MDFTMTEKTRESYNPDMPALRSEQLIKETNSGAGGAAGGVPGALTNQPPAGGTTNAGEANVAAGGGGGTSSSNSRTTRNYELDKTISHTRSSVGGIRKLSVAVLVDDLQKVDAEGKVIRSPLNDAALTRLQTLVKEAVGYDSSRGDSVNVINASFYVPEKPEELPEPGLFEKPWVHNLIKQALGGLVVLILIFGVLKPVLRSLTEKGTAEQKLRLAEATGVPVDELGDDNVRISGEAGGAGVPQLASPSQIEDKLQVAKTIVSQDPGQVAQVVKTWVASDG
jgi:flagellar M-ring protein FliF